MKIARYIALFSVLSIATAAPAQIYLPNQKKISGDDAAIGVEKPLGRFHIQRNTSGSGGVGQKDVNIFNYPLLVLTEKYTSGVASDPPKITHWYMNSHLGRLTFLEGEPGSKKEAPLLSLGKDKSVCYVPLEFEGNPNGMDNGILLKRYAFLRLGWDATYSWGIGLTDNKDMAFFSKEAPSYAIPRMLLTKEGYLALGTLDPKNYRLAVGGKMIAEEVVVKLLKDWPDYVFAPRYPLLPLEAVAKHIEQNGALPNMPAASEVASKGLELGDVTTRQQEKIEEIYLHLIRMNEEIKALRKENEALRKENEALEKSVREVEQR